MKRTLIALCAGAVFGAPGAADVPIAPSRGEAAARAIPVQENTSGGVAVDLSQDPELMPYPREGDAARLRAIERGLAWLATRQQSRDGSLGVGDASADGRAPLAVTALSALAWMAGGSTPTRGSYQDNIVRSIEYLLASAQRDADPYPGYIADASDPLSRTHGHGLATLALAEAYTMSPRSPLGKRIRSTLKAAVLRIEVSQGAEGGWEYKPYRTIQHEGSVTVALLQALRAADDVGIRVNPDTIARAVDYMGKLQILDTSDGTSATKLGGFRYGMGDSKTSVALTAAGLTTLQAAGIYSGAAFDEGYDYIWRMLLERSESASTSSSPFPYYERFYLSQALWHLRETKQFRAWAEPEMRLLIEGQGANGSWADVRYLGGAVERNRYGAAYATACNVLFLALPDDTLPVFHR